MGSGEPAAASCDEPVRRNPFLGDLRWTTGKFLVEPGVKVRLLTLPAPQVDIEDIRRKFHAAEKESERGSARSTRGK